MKLTRIFVLVLLAALAASCTKNSGGTAVIDTDLGQIKIKLDAETAPKHVENFKKLAREGFYDGSAFFRFFAIFGSGVICRTRGGRSPTPTGGE